MKGAGLAAAVLVVVIGAVLLLRSMAQETPAAPLNVNRYEASAEQGKYLARIGNCATCHTTEQGLPYAGGVEFRTPFGTLYSTNITADQETGIGGWSFADFYRSMKHGQRADGTHLYPAFPYTAFAKMSDADIASIYLYLQTIEAVDQPAINNQLQFPYNIRPLLIVWKFLFHESSSFQPDGAQSDEWNRGAYLVEGPGHCGACHTPRNLLGAQRGDLPLAGGVYLDKVKTGAYRKWSGVNLTSAKVGLASWREEDIAAYLQTGVSERAIVHGPMNEVVRNSTRFLVDADARAIATYLKHSPPKAFEPDPPADKQVLASGEVVYTVHCGSCHLPSGLGDSTLGVPLAGSAIVQAPDPASLLNVILYGPQLPPPPFEVDRTRMKMFGKRLSNQDIADVASYVRASFGNQAGAVSASQVQAQR